MTVDPAVRCARGIRSSWHGKIYAASGRESGVVGDSDEKRVGFLRTDFYLRPTFFINLE
jgi:hypothetical protein